MQALEVLRRDHERVRGLFERFRSAPPGERLALSSMIRDEVRLHSRVEEEIFYPAVRRVRAGTTRDTVKTALEVHHRLDLAIAALDEVDPDDAAFGARVEELRQLLEAHIQDQETRVFPEAAHHLSADRLDRLGSQMDALRLKLASG